MFQHVVYNVGKAQHNKTDPLFHQRYPKSVSRIYEQKNKLSVSQQNMVGKRELVLLVLPSWKGWQVGVRPARAAELMCSEAQECAVCVYVSQYS